MHWITIIARGATYIPHACACVGGLLSSWLSEHYLSCLCATAWQGAEANLCLLPMMPCQPWHSCDFARDRWWAAWLHHQLNHAWWLRHVSMCVSWPGPSILALQRTPEEDQSLCMLGISDRSWISDVRQTGQSLTVKMLLRSLLQRRTRRFLMALNRFVQSLMKSELNMSNWLPAISSVRACTDELQACCYCYC